MIIVLGLYALFALAFVVNKATLAFVSPLWLVGLRLLIGGLGACAIARILGHKLSIAQRDWPYFAVVVLCNVFLTNVLEILALGAVPAARAALIYTLSPFVGALIAYGWYGQRLGWHKWLGLLIGCVGVAYSSLSCWPGCSGHASVADGLLVGAACATVIGWSSVQELMCQRGYHALVINGVSFVIGGASAIGLACILGSIQLWSPSPFVPSVHPLDRLGVNWSLGEGGCIEGPLLLGLAGIVLAAALSTTAYVCYAYLLRRYSVVFMTFASFSSPLLTGIFGLLFLGEPITRAFVVVLACVACGLAVFYCAE